jgi:hypothetical protein
LRDDEAVEWIVPDELGQPLAEVGRHGQLAGHGLDRGMSA